MREREHEGVSGADVEGAFEEMLATVNRARENSSPLTIVGGGTKAFYGRAVSGIPLHTSAYAGVIAYEPAELVITARGGSSLTEIEKILAAQNQMLAFEPPCFGAGSTIGGVVAAGLSGPRRPYAGAVRDAILGVRILTANGEVLRFGGQVMKNVAGYDVSRLMTGAMGTLGLLLDVSLRVAPMPQAQKTLLWPLDQREACAEMLSLARQALPITALAYDGSQMRARVAGHPEAVAAAEHELKPASYESPNYWQALSNQTLDFFDTTAPLWRLSVPPATSPFALEGEWLWDWGGACRWFKSHEVSERIREAASRAGGHAVLFRNMNNHSPFAPLDPVSLKIHRRLKTAFDPDGIFNPGRMYEDF